MKRASARWFRVALTGITLFAVASAAFVMIRAARVLRTARHDVEAEQTVRFSVRPYAAAGNSGFEYISSPAAFQQAESFQGHLYVAGSSGLMEVEGNGAVGRQFLVGRDLPGSPLIALVSATLADSRVPELVLATASEGLLAFDGRAFRQIFPEDAEARAITALAGTSSGHLLMGTRKLGVLVYDGKRIESLHASLQGLHVTALAGDDADLWVGTLNQGVFHYHAGQTDHFTEAEGLPDPEVLAIARAGESAYVGTPVGVAVFDAGRFSRVVAPGIFASALLANGGRVYVGTEDQGIFELAAGVARPNAHPGAELDAKEIRQIFALDASVVAVARDGVYRRTPHARSWQRLLHPESAVLADHNVSALAAGADGWLWVGYFDRGVDVLAADRTRATHVEDEHVFCVNRILMDDKANVVDAATANGLVRFNRDGAVQQVLTRADGLIADHVTDVALYRDGLAVATPAGLTFLDGSGARSLYAFHGLVNNHVYALGVAGDELLAGTLGGLSELDKANVIQNLTTASSNLPHNWITAVVRVGPEWMVGTYGAGVLALDGSGRFRSFETASARFEVNPNAMLVTPAHVFAGSLGRGLYVYDRGTGRWWVMDRGLPSLNVTALAAGEGFIYVGTDNGLVRIAEEKLHS
jgi:ligand-binding sensor domain-containing protein